MTIEGTPYITFLLLTRSWALLRRRQTRGIPILTLPFDSCKSHSPVCLEERTLPWRQVPGQAVRRRNSVAWGKPLNFPELQRLLCKVMTLLWAEDQSGSPAGGRGHLLGLWSHCPQGKSSSATHSGYPVPPYQAHRHVSKLPFLLHAITIPPSICFPCHSATFLASRLPHAAQEQRLSSPAFPGLQAALWHQGGAEARGRKHTGQSSCKLQEQVTPLATVDAYLHS